MVVSDEAVEITDEEFNASNVLAASNRVMGNGTVEGVCDVVYVKPEGFEARNTSAIAGELERLNQTLLDEGRPYLLIGFGRWGSADPWLGIPVDWGQICGAKVIVESALPETSSMLSQGSHFFHNITSFRVFYFSLRAEDQYKIDWDWLNSQTAVEETAYARHVRLSSPLNIKVDGTTSRGVIRHD